MKRTKGRNRLRENVLLKDMAAEGRCVAKIDEKVYFISGGVPGDRVDILIEKDKKSYAEGRVYRLLEPSADRIPAFCRHFGTCGGCKWQNLEYSRQLELKTKQVKDAFQRIGKISGGEWLPIVASEQVQFYRNKLEYTFSSQRWLESKDMLPEAAGSMDGLGFHIPGRFDKVLDVQECFLQPEPSNSIRNWVKEYCMRKRLPFFQLREQTGLLRNLMIRTTLRNEIMVLLIVTEYNDEVQQLLETLHQAFPQISSLQYLINTKRNDAYSDLQPVLFRGKPWVEEWMEELRFRIGPTSFFQTNATQALRLYQTVVHLADPNKNDLVYDLYTGTGTIAQFIARKVRQVVGIEYVEAAVKDAEVNAEINGIGNVRFFCGDMAKVLNAEFVHQHGKPDIIIADPPRAGMHPSVIEAILQILPEKIVYVSCNPATQARDLASFLSQYNLLEIQPFDMFPQTHHVENVVVLKKNPNDSK
jgi:23S rRNA (uracil1939-C5)-methyltransferase